jgi:hypothetical protein
MGGGRLIRDWGLPPHADRSSAETRTIRKMFRRLQLMTTT